MLTELCQELRNWFVRSEKDKHNGTFTIQDGAIDADFLLPGQYYRIAGSIFNDGVHQRGAETENELTDETWDGAVWAMALPAPVINLAAEIAAWREKYETTDSEALSPFASESFGGYSYSKGGTGGGSGGAGVSWRSVFKDRLNMWRKILP